MAKIQKITPCLWFDGQGEDAAKFYVEVFPNSSMGKVSRYGKEGQEFHRKEPGSAMVVEFELAGHKFTALNGGPQFKFSEAISLQISCDSQEEVDHYWNKLSEGGDPKAQQCGWLKDKFGLSWQVIPAAMGKLMSGGDAAQTSRVMNAMFAMKKIDIAGLEAAARG